MNRTEAFSKYGAKLKNFVWSVAAENGEGELVLSLWKNYFKPGKGIITYVDHVSRWAGPGNKEFRTYLDDAYKQGKIVRAVIGRTSDEAALSRGVDAHTLDNTFHVREDWIGKVTLWDGENYEIEFTSRKT
jgi:hypothetical protein